MSRHQIVSIRVTDEERRRLQTLADERGVRLSVLLRDLLRPHIEPRRIPVVPVSRTVTSPATVDWFVTV